MENDDAAGCREKVLNACQRPCEDVEAGRMPESKFGLIWFRDKGFLCSVIMNKEEFPLASFKFAC